MKLQWVSPGMILALCLATGARAQERPNGFYLTSPLSLSFGYDDNFVSGSSQLDDTVSILTAPTFTWFTTTHRSSLAVDYQPEFELFSRSSSLNSWNHTATLGYRYQLSSRLSADAGDSFLSTSDSSRWLADSQFLLPRGRFQQNAFFAGLKYRVDHRSRLLFRFDNAITTMALSGPRANRFDQMTNAGTVTLDHIAGRKHSLTASYAYLHVRPFEKDVSAGLSYRGVHSLNAGYMYSVSPDLSFRMTGGVVRGREVAYTGGGAVEKQWRGMWMMVGYQRYLSFFGGFAPGGGAGGIAPVTNGLSPDSLFQSVSVRMRGNLTRRVGLDFSGQRGQSSLGDRGVRSLIGQARLDYKLSERVIVFARAEYYGQNLSQFSESALSRRRYFGGLEIVLSRPPATEDAPRRRGEIRTGPTEPQTEEPGAPEER